MVPKTQGKKKKKTKLVVKSFSSLQNTYFSVLDLNEAEQGVLVVLGGLCQIICKGHASIKF